MRNIKGSTSPLRKTLLALAVGTVAHSASAATTTDNTAKKGQEETMVVQGVDGSDFKPGGDQPVPAYLDGQIAHGGRLGMLGEQKAMECLLTSSGIPQN